MFERSSKFFDAGEVTLKKNTGPMGTVLTPLQVTLRANLLFWSVLILTGVLAFLVCGAVWDDAVKGLEKFLFLVLGGVFTLVSVMDHFYERRAENG
jgi:hypothetical protein